MNYKTVIFDFDSTLVTIEGINELARLCGKYHQISQLTERAMNGDIAFEEVFQKRLDLIQPKPDDLDQVAKLYRKNITPGAKELIRQLQLIGIKIIVVTGGYEQAILPTAKYLGLSPHQIHAIKLAPDKNRRFTKVVSNHILTRSNGKSLLVKQLSPMKKVVYVGDGSTDAAAKPHIDLFIGFGGVIHRQAVKSQSDHYLTSKSLLPIYNLIKEELC